MLVKSGKYFGHPICIVCDAKCEKAWGMNNRPRVYLEDHTLTVYPNDEHHYPEDVSINPDDYAYLADQELGIAPIDPGTYEGDQAKPQLPEERMNKWCARECERCEMVDDKDEPEDFELTDGNYPLTTGNFQWYPFYGHITIPHIKDFYMKMIPALKRTVGFIYINRNGHYEAVGTGVFVTTREDTYEFVYLVTCKHVIKRNEPYRFFVRLNRTDINDVAYVPLVGKWTYHSDKTVDLAAINFVPSTDYPCDFEPVQMDNVFLPDQLMKDYITEGDSIALIGLWSDITGKYKNSPIYRYGHIAMVTDEKIKGEYGYSDYVLVECEVFPGNSGAPLWVAIPTPEMMYPFKQTLFILGITTGFYVEVEFLVPGQKKKTIFNSRISSAIPIRLVKDMLNGDELMKDRKKQVEDNTPPDNKFISASITIDNEADNPIKPAEFTEADFEEALKKVSKRDNSGGKATSKKKKTAD